MLMEPHNIPPDEYRVRTRWPENPITPVDIIAQQFRNWGLKLAYQQADDILAALRREGWTFCKMEHSSHKPRRRG